MRLMEREESAEIVACAGNARNLPGATQLILAQKGASSGSRDAQLLQTPAAAAAPGRRQTTATSESQSDFIYGDEASPLIRQQEKADEEQHEAEVARNLHAHATANPKEPTNIAPLWDLLGVTTGKPPAKQIKQEILHGTENENKTYTKDLIRHVGIGIANLITCVVFGTPPPYFVTAAFRAGARRAGVSLGRNNDDSSKLVENTAKLAVHGKREVSNIAQGLLLSSFTTEQAQEIVEEAGWSEARRQRVIQNRAKLQEKQERGAARRAKRARGEARGEEEESTTMEAAEEERTDTAESRSSRHGRKGQRGGRHLHHSRNRR